MVLVALAVLLPATTSAQSIKLPKRGMQYLTAGLSLNPGFLYDGEASNSDLPTAAATAATMAQIGVTQVVTRRFFMSAEAQVGMQWLNDNTADQDASAPSSANFAWQIGLYASWLPFGEKLGLVGAGGLHLFQAHLEDAPLQVLGAEMRLGKYLWTTDEEFVLVRFGYSAPLIQGLNRPTDFGTESQWVERNWSFHRFSIGFDYGF